MQHALTRQTPHTLQPPLIQTPAVTQTQTARTLRPSVGAMTTPAPAEDARTNGRKRKKKKDKEKEKKTKKKARTHKRKPDKTVEPEKRSNTVTSLGKFKEFL